MTKHLGFSSKDAFKDEAACKASVDKVFKGGKEEDWKKEVEKELTADNKTAECLKVSTAAGALNSVGV